FVPAGQTPKRPDDRTSTTGAKPVSDDSSGPVHENTVFDSKKMTPTEAAASASAPRPPTSALAVADPAAFYRKSLADLTAVAPFTRKRSIATAEISDVPSSRELESPVVAQPDISAPTEPANHSSALPDNASAAAGAGSPVVAKKERRNRRCRRDGLQLDNPFAELVSEIPLTNARYATRRRTAEAAAFSTGGLSTPLDVSSAPAIPAAARKTLPGKMQKGKTAVKAEKHPATEKPTNPEKAVKRRRTRGLSVASAAESGKTADISTATESAATVIKAEPRGEPIAEDKETALEEPDNRHLEKEAAEGTPAPSTTCELKEHSAAAIRTSDFTAQIPTEDSNKPNETPETESTNADEKSPALKPSNGAGTGSDNTEKSPAGKENTPEPTKAATKISPPLKAAGTPPTGGPGSSPVGIPFLARATRRRRGADQQLVADLDSTPPRASSAAAPRPPRTFPGRITRNRVHEGESVLALAFARTAQKPYSNAKMACPIPDIATDAARLPTVEDRCKRRFEVPDWVFAPRGRVCATGKKAVIPSSGAVDPEFSTLRTNAPSLPDVGGKYSDLHPTACDAPAACILEKTEATPSISSSHQTIAKRPIAADHLFVPPQPAKRLRWRWLDPHPPSAPPHPDLHRFTHPHDETHTFHSRHLPIERALLPAPAWLPRELDALAAGLAAVGKSFTRIAREFVGTRATADCVEAYYVGKHEMRRAAGWVRVQRKGPVAMAISKAAAAAAACGVADGKDAGMETRRTKLLKTAQTGDNESAGTAHKVGAVEKVEKTVRVEEVRGTVARRGRRGRGGKGIGMK
ncbi:hypothetical protein DFJ73DRAFT_914040, partial [Zopfochytrium polystomum]